jgi:unsaturated chondroitin disaccharide hydrolase
VSLPTALEQVSRLVDRFPSGFPSAYGAGNRYHAVSNHEWTPGFWAGLLWLAYQHTGDPRFRARAEALLPSFADRLDAGGAGVQTHDLGFLYTLSSISCWRLTRSQTARTLALRAADLLTERFWRGGRVIQAWGSMDDEQERGRIIIDSTMNMPLLFWAAEETARPHYRDIAVNHLDQCARLLVRPDDSTFHTYFVDTETGEGRYGKTHQGLSDASCWARGQAWGIYGFSLAYRHTREDRFLGVAQRLAAYFLDRLPSDGICRWDLAFGDQDQEERDTSAAAIAASGLLELSSHLEPDAPGHQQLTAAASRIMETLVARHQSTNPAEDGILLNGVCHRPLGHGVNECCLWGDYFFLEALLREEASWSSFW